jgi:hypothetical protein
MSMLYYKYVWYTVLKAVPPDSTPIGKAGHKESVYFFLTFSWPFLSLLLLHPGPASYPALDHHFFPSI